MRLLAYKKVSLTAQKTEPYTAWKALYAKLKSTPQKTQAALSLQWLWLLQKGSSVAPAVYEDQQKLSLDQSPFVTGGGYLRTEANAYLTKQLKQIDTRLNTKGRIITIVPHAAINALQILYQSSILKVPHTHLSRMMSEIRTAAHDNKVIWVTFSDVCTPNDIQFMTILEKKQYKLLWSFAQMGNTGPLPLTVICGKKEHLWDHPQLLSHSGYCPDKASVDMMVIKLELADKKEAELDAVFPEKIDLVSPNAPDVQVLGQCGVAALHKLNKNGSVGDSATLYQQLGQLYHQHFAHIRLTRRDNLRDNTEINALITTLKKQLDAADTQLAHPDLKNQYKALRDMTDTLLVAETLRDAAALASSDFPYFAPRPDQVHITNYGMTTLTSAILSYKKAFPNTIPKVTSMAHTYFETSGVLAIFNTIHPHFCSHHAGVMDIASIPTDTDILVIEPHPNNVTEKAPIAPPSLKTLAQKLCTMSQNRIRPLLVILDITIGVISDPKLKTFIINLDKSIASQKIQVVMGQSLVKFGALGIDVASAGLSLVWSQNTAYKTALAPLLDEAKPPAHVQAFYAFMLTKGLSLAAQYLDRIRRNTQQLSDHILSELSKIQMGNRDIRIMDIHPNLDRGTCYIGLDFDAFLPQFKDKTSLEKIAREVCNTLQKIASDDGFLLTNRSSFGFPFSNISVCGSAIRLTVGIESPETMKQLADIVSILAVGLKWHTQDLSDPKIESTAISQDVLAYINSTQKQREPALTNRELTKILQKITRISRESKTGFSRELISVEKLYCGEYETEDGFAPDFNWKKTGVGTLSWHPNQDHFEWQFPGRSPQTMAYLEIDPGYAVDASSRSQRAIALLGIENNPTLYDERQLNGHVPKDMQKSHFSHIFGNKDKTLQVWSQDLLDDDPVIRSIEVDNGTRINGDYFPPDKTFIYHESGWWKQSEMEGRILKQWKKKLGDEQYICHIKQSSDSDSVKLKLSPQPSTKIARG